MGSPGLQPLPAGLTSPDLARHSGASRRPRRADPPALAPVAGADQTGTRRDAILATNRHPFAERREVQPLPRRARGWRRTVDAEHVKLGTAIAQEANNAPLVRREFVLGVVRQRVRRPAATLALRS